MSWNNNNNNDQPKPSSKGKEQEQNTDTHGWGKTNIKDWTWKPDPLTQPVPGPTHVGPSMKQKRCGLTLTHSQKRNCDEEAEEAYNDTISDDEIMKDLTGEAPAHAEGLHYMLTLSEADKSDVTNTIPGNNDVMMGAPPSLRSKSTERHLKPPTWAEPSSSAGVGHSI